MEGILLTLIFIGCVILLISLWKLAKKDTLLGHIIKAWWNISLTIVSIFPFCGWLARFMIADNEEEEAAKRQQIQIGEDADDIALDAMLKSAERDRAYQAEVAERARLEREINAALGRTDAHITGNNAVEIGGKKYSLSSVKDKLHIH